MDRTSLSCAWLGLPTTTREAPHKQIYDQGGSPQTDLRPGKLPIDFCMQSKRKPPRITTRVPNRNPLPPQGLPTIRIATREAPHKQSCDREAPHKQNYDQGAYPQAGLRPGSWLAGWLAELAGWLTGWLGGWLAGLLTPRKAQKGPERPREAQKSGAWIEQACRALGWGSRKVLNSSE